MYATILVSVPSEGAQPFTIQISPPMSSTFTRLRPESAEATSVLLYIHKMGCQSQPVHVPPCSSFRHIERIPGNLVTCSISSSYPLQNLRLNMFLILVALLFAAVAAQPAHRFIARQASPVLITSVTHQGTGCPSGWLAYDNDPDRRSTAITYESFEVSIGDNLGPPAQASCDVTIGLRYPSGCTSATFDITFRGFIGLVENGVRGTATAQFSLSSGTVSPSKGDSIPFSTSSKGNWIKTYNVASTARLQGARDLNLTIKNEMSLSSSNRKSKGDIQAEFLLFPCQVAVYVLEDTGSVPIGPTRSLVVRTLVHLNYKVHISATPLLLLENGTSCGTNEGDSIRSSRRSDTSPLVRWYDYGSQLVSINDEHAR